MLQTHQIGNHRATVVHHGRPSAMHNVPAAATILRAIEQLRNHLGDECLATPEKGLALREHHGLRRGGDSSGLGAN